MCTVNDSKVLQSKVTDTSTWKFKLSPCSTARWQICHIIYWGFLPMIFKFGICYELTVYGGDEEIKLNGQVLQQIPTNL